jgi:hypothetical protein
VLNADPELYRYLKNQIDTLDHENSDDLVDQVRRALHSALFIHQATADYIAALFSIHPRTQPSSKTLRHQLPGTCRTMPICTRAAITGKLIDAVNPDCRDLELR